MQLWMGLDSHSVIASYCRFGMGEIDKSKRLPISCHLVFLFVIRPRKKKRVRTQIRHKFGI